MPNSPGESVAKHRVNLFNSLNRICLKYLGTRIFVSRRQTQDKVAKCLSGRVTAIYITPKRSAIRYLRCSLDEDTMPDVMDRSLGGACEEIPKDISERALLAYSRTI